jgi:hypothetical protein
MINSNPIKALSLWQPWASLIACGVKVHETRHWSPPIRLIGQRLAIHAAKKIGDVDGALDAILTDRFGWGWSNALPLGAIVATCTLANVYETGGRVSWTTPEDIICGDWYPGRFAWHLTEVRKVDPPMPCRGAQGLWTLNPT